MTIGLYNGVVLTMNNVIDALLSAMNTFQTKQSKAISYSKPYQTVY
jgi:hypothetical protein